MEDLYQQIDKDDFYSMLKLLKEECSKQIWCSRCRVEAECLKHGVQCPLLVTEETYAVVEDQYSPTDWKLKE